MKTLLFAFAVSMIIPAFSAHAECKLDTPIKLSELNQGAFTKVFVDPDFTVDNDEDEPFISSDKVILEFSVGPEIIDDVDVLGARLKIDGSKLSFGPDSVNEDQIDRVLFKNQSFGIENAVYHSIYEGISKVEETKVKAFSDIAVVGDEIRSIKISHFRLIHIGATQIELFRSLCVTHASR